MSDAKTLNQTSARIGFWSACASATLAIAYILAEGAHLAGLLGPHDSPLSFVLRFTPSLLLAIAFVVLMTCVHACATGAGRVWTHTAQGFAVIYAVLVSLVYYVQLTVVIPLTTQGLEDQAGMLRFGFGTFMYAVDILGYGFMSLATLFAAPAFNNGGRERWLRRVLIINGLLAPVIALQILYPALWMVATLWGVTFPAATIMLARWFAILRRTGD